MVWRYPSPVMLRQIGYNSTIIRYMSSPIPRNSSDVSRDKVFIWKTVTRLKIGIYKPTTLTSRLGYAWSFCDMVLPAAGQLMLNFGSFHRNPFEAAGS